MTQVNVFFKKKVYINWFIIKRKLVIERRTFKQ